MCADWIANWSITKPLGTHVLDHPPLDLSLLRLSDMVGVCIPRFISV